MRRWSVRELGVLRRLWRTAPWDALLAALPDRTKVAITSKSADLGLAGRAEHGPHKWKRHEDATLKRLYPTVPRDEVCEALPGRGWEAIMRRARQNKVKRIKRPDYPKARKARRDCTLQSIPAANV